MSLRFCTRGELGKLGGNNPGADTNPPEDQEDTVERVGVGYWQAWFYHACNPFIKTSCTRKMNDLELFCFRRLDKIWAIVPAPHRLDCQRLGFA